MVSQFWGLEKTKSLIMALRKWCLLWGLRVWHWLNWSWKYLGSSEPWCTGAGLPYCLPDVDQLLRSRWGKIILDKQLSQCLRWGLTKLGGGIRPLLRFGPWNCWPPERQDSPPSVAKIGHDLVRFSGQQWRYLSTCIFELLVVGKDLWWNVSLYCQVDLLGY